MRHSLAVVIPAHNAANRVGKAVASALAAGATEVLVVDDGSTDDTAEVARICGATVIEQVNAGAAEARRNGVLATTSDWVILLDADDELVPAGVAASLRMAIETPGTAAVAGRVLGEHEDGSTTLIKPWSTPITARELVVRGYGACPPAALTWSRPILERALVGDPKGVWPSHAEDYELLIRVAMRGEIRVHGEVSCIYRLVGGKSARKPLNSVIAAEQIRAYYAPLLGVSFRSRGKRARRALATIRVASGLNRWRLHHILHLLKAGIQHPPTLATFIAHAKRSPR